MAIRSIEVKKILYALRYLKNIKENYTKDNKVFTKELVSEYPYYLNHELHSHFLSVGLIRIKDLIDQFEDILRETYLITPKENKVTTSESNITLIRSIIHNSPELKEEKLIIREESYKSEKQEYDDYTITLGMLKGEKTYDVGFVRPTYNLHIIENNTLDIPINLNLPTEEIVAFIEKIKENSDVIKSPLELLEEELETIDPENVEKYLPKTFDARLKTMANALFTYDTFQYLTNKQKPLVIKRDELKNKLDDELSKYTKPGAKTKHQKINIKKITAKYDIPIKEFNTMIDDIGRTSESKHKKIGNKIDVSESTIERYLIFINNYIKNEKYKRLFIKTKD